MANSLGNIKSLFSNVKTRTIIIITGIILFLIIIVGLLGFKKANNTGAAANLKKPSNIASVPGIETTTPQYALNQQQVNEKNYQQAQATQGTAVPTVINQQGLNNGMSPSDYNVGLNNSNGQGTGVNNGIANGSTDYGANANTTGANGDMNASDMQALLAQQKAQLDALQQKVDATANQEQQQQLQQTQSAMQQQAQQLLSSWNSSENVPTQAFVQGTAATTAGNNNPVSGGLNNGTQNNAGTINNTNNNGMSNDIMIKSGTIFFATLDTSVNSDEPGPILATIVSGTYKGSKLIGSIQQSPEIPGSNGPTALIISFNTMNVPFIANSIGISAVAIDPDTARTALASDVDHHYVQRYGSLFASSFLEGWGESISQAGTNITVSPFGGTSSTAPTLTAGQQVAAGLGQVGQSWGQELGDTFNRQNTVTINAGIAMGILFLSDVSSAGNTSTLPAPTTTTSTPTSATAGATANMANSMAAATNENNNPTIAAVPPPAT